MEAYPGTNAAKKAAGSLRRLDLVGQVVSPSRARACRASRSTRPSIAARRSWSSSGPVGPLRSRHDLPGLIKAHEKYHRRGLEIIGVNLDNERADLDAFLKANPIAWPQIFEGGGMETRLAIEYGITSVPTMFLIDAQGKVVNRNLRTSTEVDRQLEKLLPADKPAGGVALDQR